MDLQLYYGNICDSFWDSWSIANVMWVLVSNPQIRVISRLTPSFVLEGLEEKVAFCELSSIATAMFFRNIFALVCFYFRQTTQDAPEEVRNRDFRRELEERERVAAREKNRDRPTRGTNTYVS